MFTKINGELYKVKGNEMVKVTIKNGVIKTDNKVQEYKGGTYLLTIREVKRQYASLFENDIVPTEVKADTQESEKQVVEEKTTKDEVKADTQENE